jgi:transposase
VYQVKNRFNRDGIAHSFVIGGHRKSCLVPMQATLRQWIKDQADLTLNELCERLAEHGIAIKASALWRQLDKWGLSFKKNAARQRTGTRGCTKSADGLEAKPGHTASEQADFSGRNGNLDQHDPHQRAQPKG